MTEHFEISILGAGITGILSAISLDKLGFKVLLLDKVDITRKPNLATNTGKNLVLDMRCVAFLKEIDIWKELKKYATKIEKIIVTNYDGKYNRKLDNDNFGCSFRSDDIMKVIYKKLIKTDVQIKQAEISQIIPTHNGNILKAPNLTVETSFVIGAEGRSSSSAKLLGASFVHSDYHQEAVVFDIKHDQQKPFAYEIILEHGLLVLIPLGTTISTAIYVKTLNNDEAYSNDALLNISSQYLSNPKLDNKSITYKLAKQYICEHPTNPGYIAIGDAAHGIHPVLAQGLNLAVRDVIAVYELSQKYKSLGFIVGNEQMLNEYKAERKRDVKTIIALCDAVAKVINYPIIKRALLKISTNIAPGGKIEAFLLEKLLWTINNRYYEKSPTIS